MQKVLITSVYMGIGGIETALLELLNNIDYKKYEVDLILLKKSGENFKKIPKNTNVYNFFELNNKFSYLSKIIKKDNIVSRVIRNLIFNRYTIKRFVPNKKYNVGIAFAGYSLPMDLYVAYSNCQRKYIWVHTDVRWLYNNNSKYKKNFNKTFYKYNYFDKIITVSKSAKEEFIKLQPYYKNKVDYIWSFFPTLKSNIKIELKGNYKILSVGRLVQQKGFNRMVEIIKSIINLGYDVTCYIIGDGKEYKQLKQQIRANNLEKSIILLGSKNNVLDYMNSVDLYLSTSYNEGFQIVLIEALNSQLPIVCPKIIGAKDIAINIAPKDSFILTNNNIGSIKNGIIRAINGEINKSFIFDVKEFNKLTLKKYRKVLDGKL